MSDQITSVDLNKIKELIDKKNNKGNKLGDKFFSPQDGDNLVRILPLNDNSGLFFKETGEHNLDGKRHYCPKLTKGSKCPICETVRELYNTNAPEKIAYAKSIKARKKYYSNVIVRGKEEEGPKIWGYGVKIYEKILSFFADEDFGDITDVKTGFDFKVTREQKDGFPNYDNSRPKPKSSPLSANPEDVVKWFNGQHNLNEMVDGKLLSYSDLKKAMLGEAIGEADDEKIVAAAKKEVAAAPQVEEETPADDLASIMEEARQLGKKKAL